MTDIKASTSIAGQAPLVRAGLAAAGVLFGA
jgi:hypothetical protein